MMINKNIILNRYKRLNYKAISKMKDEEYILINNNLLYYLLFLYQRKRNKSANDLQSIKILYQHFDDLSILEYYGIYHDIDGQLYNHMQVKNAKTILKPWEKDKEFFKKLFVIENNTPVSYNIESLRERYSKKKKKLEYKIKKDI